MPTTLTIGTIVAGSCHIRDTLPACLFTIESVSQEEGTRFNQELSGLGFGYSQCGVGFGPIEDWPIDADEAYEIQAEILEALIDYAPPFTYVGTHPGDGADLGCWPDHDAIEMAIHDKEMLRIGDLADLPANYTGGYVLVNDHGNMTLGHAINGESVQVHWAIV